MDECWNLKGEIEKLVKKEVLSKFTRQREDGRIEFAAKRIAFVIKDKARDEKDDYEILGTINMIARGFESVRDERKKEKTS